MAPGLGSRMSDKEEKLDDGGASSGDAGGDTNGDNGTSGDVHRGGDVNSGDGASGDAHGGFHGSGDDGEGYHGTVPLTTRTTVVRPLSSRRRRSLTTTHQSGTS
mmetsp:Transcript_38489/g.66781  ORF Transcript_38489/g.66781 Transcript_38489/m.66781 type:complete len:104 (-) Transcript_38489:78-389(-)